MKDKTTVHFVAPRFKEEDLWRDPFWHFRRELKAHLPFGTAPKLVRLARDAALLVLRDPSQEKMIDLIVDQSQKHFLEWTRNYQSGQEYNPQDNSLLSDQYSHTRLFSWIYWVESRFIRKLTVGESQEGRYAVLDLGSSLGHSLFVKSDLLSDLPVSLVGVDTDPIGVAATRRYIQRNGLGNVKVFNIDIDRKGWEEHVTAGAGGPFDFVTASHLLEHLNGKNPVEYLLEWFQMAKRGMVISVPFEGQLRGISEHRRVFTPEILRELGNELSRLTGVEAVPDFSQVEAGILIVRRAVSVERLQSARGEAVKAWGGVTVTPPSKEITKRLLPVFYAPKTFHAIPLVAKAGSPFLVIAASQAEEDGVLALLDDLKVGRDQYMIRRSDLEKLVRSDSLTKALQEFTHYDTYPVDPSRPAWLDDLLARIRQEGIIPIGDIAPALQATERYFQILA